MPNQDQSVTLIEGMKRMLQRSEVVERLGNHYGKALKIELIDDKKTTISSPDNYV